MLTQLDIQNYILIDELQIHLSNQLSVITGETGQFLLLSQRVGWINESVIRRLKYSSVCLIESA